MRRTGRHRERGNEGGIRRISVCVSMNLTGAELDSDPCLQSVNAPLYQPNQADIFNI